MTIDWGLVWSAALVLLAAFGAWSCVEWLWAKWEEMRLYRRVERHATERWLERARRKADEEEDQK